MKKFLSLLLALTMVFSLSTPALAISTPSLNTEEMRTILHEKGFPYDFLNRRFDHQIEDLYNDCINENIVYGGSEISYLFENEEYSPTRGTIPAGDMALEITTLYRYGRDNNGNETYTECWVFIYYEWTSGHPFIKKTDGITVNWDPNVWNYNGDFLHNDFADNMTTTSTVTRPSYLAQGGLGYSAYLLPVGSSLHGNTKFILVPAKYPLYPSSTGKPHFTSTINVNYGHDKNPLTWVTGVSFSYEGVGVGLTLGDLTDEAATSYIGYYKWK